MPINGNYQLIFRADNLAALEKVILRSFIETTKNVSGCQAIRAKIGHIMFGFRVIHGECLFVTISPNRRHSALILHLSRVRRNDTAVCTEAPVAKWRKKCAGRATPRFCTACTDCEDRQYRTVKQEIPLPTLLQRQAWMAQDPLANIHHFQAVMYVLVPASFGVRMCLNCPHCNFDSTNPKHTGDKSLGAVTCKGATTN